MRFVDIAHIAALISCGAFLSACPKKDEAAPEPAGTTAPAAAPVSDKAGAEPPAAAPAAAPAKKKADDDKGGW